MMTVPNYRVVVVTVSYNTLELTALLLWSLRRVLECDEPEIVVVDNGSTDGSPQLLADAQRAGLCVLLANDRNVGHGLALNQALAWLSGRPRPPDRVWILDSDCVVARPEVLTEISSSPATADAAIVGEPHWDPWHRRERFELYSLLIDPARAHAAAAPFTAGGDPAFDLLDAAERQGLELAAFPFTAEGFIVHLGRGSLAAVAAAGDDEHPLYGWAVDHHEPHFGGIQGAAERYLSVLNQFHTEVGSPVAPRLVRALTSAS